MNISKFTEYRFTIFWTIIILILSFIKLPPSSGPSIPHTDKIVHLALYLILGIFLQKELKNTLIGILYIAILGGTIEILQSLITNYRTGDIIDFLFDLIGGILGLYHYKLINTSK